MQDLRAVQTQGIILAGLFMAMGLSGCGAGSVGGGETVGVVSGQFLDSAVGGLAYSCSSGKSGLTDNNGEYTCDEGDTVTFSINGFVIGSTSASDLVTPNSLASDSAQALNIAQLLQTLDVDNDPTNGVSIAQYGEQYDAMAAMANDGVSLGQSDFDTTVAAYISETLVDETTAQNHLNDTISSLIFNAASIKAALAGKTAYPAQSSPIYSEVWVIAADGLTSSGSGVDENGPWTDGATLSYTDTSFTVTSDNPDDIPVTFMIKSITNDYIETDLGKIYFTQSKAYTDAIIAAVAGRKTYPQQSSLSYSQEWAFDQSATSAVITGVDQFGEFTDHAIITYSGTTFTVTNNDPGDSDYGNASTFTALDITSNHVQVEDSGATQFGIFYTQQDAYVGL